VLIWVAAILLITAVGLFIAAPLSEQVFGDRGFAGSAESERREHEHALAVQALRELEFDYAMGKVGAGDYRVLKEKLENRALASMGKREEAPRPTVVDSAPPAAASPRPIAAARTFAVNFCPQCNTRTGTAHNFCVNCGAELVVTASALR
jgi:hypothetical protein